MSLWTIGNLIVGILLSPFILMVCLVLLIEAGILYVTGGLDG